MSPAAPTKVIGSMMMGSLVLAGGAAIAGPRLLGFEGVGPDAAPVVNGLVYVSAAALLALLAWAPKLAKRLDERGAQGNGKILAMAMCEGMGLLGIAGAALGTQKSWAIALAMAGVLAVARVMSQPA